MFHCGRLVLAAGILLATTAAAARGADETHDIRLQRPFQAGLTFSLSATNTLRSAEKVELPNGSVSRTSIFRRVILDAEMHVDKVDAQGAEAEVTLTIRKLTLQSADADQAGEQTFPNAVLDPGTQVRVLFGGGQANFALKKAGVLSDEATIALLQGFKRMSITDAVYGTKDKKKVGDTWPLNKEALSGDRTSPQYIDPTLISGTVALKALRTLSGVACQQIEGNMTTRDFQVQGLIPREATMTTVFTINAPVDLAKQTVAWNVRSTTHFVTEEKPLGQGTVRRTVDSEILHEATMMPK